MIFFGQNLEGILRGYLNTFHLGQWPQIILYEKLFKMIFFRLDWKERLMIGSGSFGTVFKCSLINNPSVCVAIKTINNPPW